MNLSKSIITLFLITILSLLPGCWNKKTPVEIGNTQQILHKGNSGEPEDLDPHIVTGLPEYHILSALFEGLVGLDPQNLHPTPGVAKSWDISPDGRTYTFHLRNDAKWSNGDPVTADDFLFSYQRVLSKNLGSPYTARFYHLTGAEDYHKGITQDFSTVGIKAVDDHTLQLQLKEPIPYFLSLISFMTWYPVHKDTLLKHGNSDQRGTGWTRTNNLVSNGPFKLKEWNMGHPLIVEKNPHYWDSSQIRLNQIHFHPITNSNTEELAFKTGKLHLTETIPLPKVASYKDSPFLFTTPFFSTYTYAFNTTKPPFNDPRIRQALSLSIDRKSIVENVTKRQETPAHSFVPFTDEGYHSTAKLQEDVEKAKQLLAEAGYPNGQGFPPVTLLYNTSDAHRSVAEALQYMWSKNLNIHVELVNQEWKSFLKERAGGTFNLYRLGWVGDYMDPNAFLEIFTSQSANNMSGWSNPEYDNLISLANQTMDQQQRFAYLDKAENILMQELPVMPIYFYVTTYLKQPSVKNWYPNLIDIHPYKQVYLDDSNN